METLKWLVDKHGCPISIKQDSRTGRLQSVQTSAGRSLIDLAMTGKPKLAILRYLVMEKNLSVMDTKDPSLAPRTLEALLRSGVSRESAAANVSGEVDVHIIDDNTDHSGTVTLDDAVCGGNSGDWPVDETDLAHLYSFLFSALFATRDRWTAS